MKYSVKRKKRQELDAKMNEVSKAVCRKYGIRSPRIFAEIHETNAHDYGYCCYKPRFHTITLQLKNYDFNKTQLFVLLHELGHAIDYKTNGKQVKKRGNHYVNVHHGETFWKIVYELYQEYDVVIEALREEYPAGKKQLRKMGLSVHGQLKKNKAA